MHTLASAARGPDANSSSTIETLESRTSLSAAYAVADLGLLGASLNNNGEVLLQAPVAAGHGATVYQSGQMIASPPLNKHKQVLPLFMNDTGMIAGTFYTGHTILVKRSGLFGGPPIREPVTDAFLFDGRHFRDLGVGAAAAMNDSGVVVGTNNGLIPSTAGSSGRGFIYQHRHRSLLARNFRYDDVTSINSAGDVVFAAGTADIVSGECYEYSHVTHKLIDLGVNGRAAQINNFGQTVGVTSGNGAFLVNNQAVLNLGTLGGPGAGAVSINDSGAIVGTSQLADTGQRDLLGNIVYPTAPFLYAGGTMADLTTLAPASETGWKVASPASINNSGQILAWGTNSSGGASHILLLTPTT